MDECIWRTGGIIHTWVSGNIWPPQQKKLSIAILSTTDFTWNDLVSKPGLPGDKPVSN